MKKPVKQKKCKHCKNMFTPVNTIERLCSVPCILADLSEKKKKKVRQGRTARKKAYNEENRSYQLKKAQEVFNAYIRARDYGNPCISCGRNHGGQIHAGHYRSVGAAPHLRFNQFNVHSQCQPCNNHKSGNAIEYRIGLVAKVGVEKVEWIESQNEPAKWTIDEIKAIKTYYKKLLKEVKRV